MLGEAEYNVATHELWQIALEHKGLLQQQLLGVDNKQLAIKNANDVADSYSDDVEELTRESLEEITDNAVDYYEGQTGVVVPKKPSFVKKIVDNAYRQRYYGLNLAQRQLLNRRRLKRNITRSAQVGEGFTALEGIFTDSVPFGAQATIDRRILLGQAVKAEQDAAKAVAGEGEIKLLRWTLSHRHRTPDVCDDLAKNIDEDVIEYIEQNKIDVKPAGVYFVNRLPSPPHPHCMCEFGMVTEDKVEHGPLRRTADAVINLWKRLRSK